MNKQIEEMIAVLKLCRDVPLEECRTKVHCTAEQLYNAGYRKKDEVAKRIIQEVRNAWANSWTESEFLEMLKEILKKYGVTEE